VKTIFDDGTEEYKLKSVIKRLAFRFKKVRSENELLKNNLYHSQLKALCKAKCCDIKLDLSVYDCVISAEEVQCNYFLAYNVIAKKKIGYIHPDYNNVPYDKRIDRKALSKLDYICATSEANANSIKRAISSLENKVVGVPNPIGVDSIIQKANQPMHCVFSTEVVNIVTVCRLDNTYKALDRLILVAQKMKDNGDKFVWRIVGEGDYGETMRKDIKKYDLQDNIIMMGYLENPIPMVNKSDLFVLQSYSEGYPMSVNEALAVDTPVLVTNYPSSAEQVENKVTGYIAENDFDSVYEALHYVINNKQELKNMRDNLKKRDKSKYDNIDNLLRIMR